MVGGVNYNEVVRRLLSNNPRIMVRMDEFGVDGKKIINPRSACSSTLVFFKIEEKTSLTEVSTKTLFVGLGTKRGRENIFRKSKYGNMSKV